jgi:hypothetical protein
MLTYLPFIPLVLTLCLDPVNAHEARADKPLLDTHLNGVIEKALKASNVKASALHILHPDGSSEFGSWGSSTEDGANVTSKVGSLHNL